MQLRQCGLHRIDEGAQPWRLLARGGKYHVYRQRRRLLSDNLFVVQQAACAGLGAAVVSAWLVAGDLAQGRLVQLLPDWQPKVCP